MIDQAIRYAALVHKGQIRKGSGQPYIFHPLEVLHLVSLMTLDDDILCAAVLHDAIEDTDATYEDIRREFGEHVAKLVSYETEDKRVGQDKASTWVERKKEAIETIRNIDEIGGKMVCLGDKVSNLRSFHLGLLDEGDAFWDHFNQKDPKMHDWYYSELKDALAELKDQAVYKEYVFLIDTVFSAYREERDK